MLRIHFTTADLARMRIAARPDPLWELMLSMHVLRLRDSNPLLSAWRQRLIRRLHPGGALFAETRLPFALNPPMGYFPDFLTPHEGLQGFEPGLDALLSTPKARLRDEVSQLDMGGPELGGIRSGTASVLRGLGSGLRRYHEVAIGPIWQRIVAAFNADRAMRAQTIVDAGPEEMLNRLVPKGNFQAGVLTFPTRSERDLHLEGRGLTLIPSYFKEEHTFMLLADSDLPPVLLYPIDRQLRVQAEARRAPLASLIGAQRTAVLELAGSGLTVSEIAKRLGMTPSGASRQLAVLREAGLLLGLRERNQIRHTLTPLGLALLTQDPQPRI